MRQAAALPYRHADGPGGQVEVLLVTTISGRWIIPKGDIDDGLEPHRAAEKEAFEEGGVKGRIARRSIGSFQTYKQQDGAEIPVEVDVFPLEVAEELEDWPEKEQRQRRWLRPDEAAACVDEAQLASLVTDFAP